MNQTAGLLRELLAIDDLEIAQQRIDGLQGKDSLRRALIQEFLELVEYQDAHQWLRAVRLCELLALVGWEPWERVDALAHYNGDCWTTGFFTDRDERRYQYGRWTKRKAGWVLFNPEYHFSHDRPDSPARDWNQYECRDWAPADVDRLATQRNYLPRAPFSISVIGPGSPDLNRAAELRRELSVHLTDAMVRRFYGDALKYFYITLVPGDDSSEPLSIGAYRSKARAFSCDLGIPPGFAALTTTEQKAFFQEALAKAIAALRKKVQRKKLSFDFQTFSADVEAAFDAWSLEGSPA